MEGCRLTQNRIVPLHGENKRTLRGGVAVCVGLLVARIRGLARPVRCRNWRLVLGIRTVGVVGGGRRVGGLPAVVAQAVFHGRVGAQEVVVAHLGVEAAVCIVGVERVVPGGIHVIPVTAHLHHVPGVIHGDAGNKDTGNAYAREQQLVGERIALAHSRAVCQSAVCGISCRERVRTSCGTVVGAVAN